MTHLALKNILDKFYKMHSVKYLSTDPLSIVRKYKDPRDQEIVGFIAAALAIGRVNLIQKAIKNILDKMGSSPYRFVIAFNPHRNINIFHPFVYRFYTERDIGLLIWWIHQMIDEFGSIKDYFLKHYCESDRDIGQSLHHFVQTIQTLSTNPFYSDLPQKGSSIRHFLADPKDGSSCKRLNLFLRWMVRKDHLDLGLWNEICPSKLIIPLDTHIARISRKIGLTERVSLGWKMAKEITTALRNVHPSDPVKYDFALCHIGMHNPCPKDPNKLKCALCPIVQFCNHFTNNENKPIHRTESLSPCTC